MERRSLVRWTWPRPRVKWLSVRCPAAHRQLRFENTHRPKRTARLETELLVHCGADYSRPFLVTTRTTSPTTTKPPRRIVAGPLPPPASKRTSFTTVTGIV